MQIDNIQDIFIFSQQSIDIFHTFSHAFKYETFASAPDLYEILLQMASDIKKNTRNFLELDTFHLLKK